MAAVERATAACASAHCACAFVFLADFFFIPAVMFSSPFYLRFWDEGKEVPPSESKRNKENELENEREQKENGGEEKSPRRGKDEVEKKVGFKMAS